MADKATSKAIWAKKKEISNVETEREQWSTQLPGVEQALETANPHERPEWEVMRDEILREVSGFDKKLAALRDELAALEDALPKKPEPAAPKFDPEKHPLLRKATEKVEPAKPVNFNAGDICEAQWTDKLWYKVKVQTVLGSASDPKYHVRFLDYKDTTLTVGRDAIRPLVNEKKRKAEIAPATPTVASVTNSPHVISGPASINPDALAAKKDAGLDPNAPTNRRKIGSNKALERKESNWKNFLAKGPGKQVAKKESMFRSGTGVNSRVGFTGSGAGMTETHKRTRYNNKGDDDEENEGKFRDRKDDWSSRSRQ